jgi:hypothetical protein
MNVAEDVRNSRFVELNKLRASAFVQAEIETLAVEQRKYIVKKRIVIGELDLPARRNYQQGRMKAFIFLNELRNLCCLLRRSRGHRCRPKRGKPYHNSRSIADVPSVSRKLHFTLEVDILCRSEPAHQQDAAHRAAMHEAKHLQKSIPMARFIWFVVLAAL